MCFICQDTKMIYTPFYDKGHKDYNFSMHILPCPICGEVYEKIEKSDFFPEGEDYEIG